MKQYIVHGGCHIVKGHLRNVLIDTQRYNYEFIPHYIFSEGRKLISKQRITQSLLEEMEQKEYIFEADKLCKIKYLEYSKKSHFSNHLTAVCLDYLFVLTTPKKKLISLFKNTVIYYAAIIVETEASIEKLRHSLLKIKELNVFSIDIVFLVAQNTRCESLSNESILGRIISIEKKEIRKSFIIDKFFFTESQQYHTYFNRKLYIDKQGEIKNAPECSETFGNIKDIKISEELKALINTSEFQKYWHVHKEKLDVCRDCEFRHICMDNRLPHQRKNGTWYHRQECTYNPYIAKWKGQEGYKTLQESGVTVTEQGYTRDDKKLEKINNELWGED